MQKLVIRDLYGGFKKKTIVKGINLSFQVGALYGILGCNGSGKTTLLKTVAGITPPLSGEVLWGEESLLSLRRKQISQVIALVPQNPQVPFDFTVSEIVAMGHYASAPGNSLLQTKPIQQKIEKVLGEVNALHLIDRRLSKISQGEKQRVYIARALISNAPVILFDEPTSNLDIKHNLEIWSLLKELAKEKIVITATHDLVQSEMSCDQIVVIDGGEIVTFDTPEKALDQEILSAVFGVKRTIVSAIKFSNELNREK